MSTLIYIGANVGDSLSTLINRYDSIHAFEPDPEIFEVLKNRFQSYSHVKLVNAACADKNGIAIFYVTPNRVSSSLGIVSTLTIVSESEILKDEYEWDSLWRVHN